MVALSPPVGLRGGTRSPEKTPNPNTGSFTQLGRLRHIGRKVASLHLTDARGRGLEVPPPRPDSTFSLSPGASQVEGREAAGTEGRLGPGKEALGKLAQINNENEEERVFSPLPSQINI